MPLVEHVRAQYEELMELKVTNADRNGRMDELTALMSHLTRQCAVGDRTLPELTAYIQRRVTELSK